MAWIKLLIKAGASSARGEGAAFEVVCANFFMLLMTVVGSVYSVMFYVLDLTALAIMAPIATACYPWGILWNARGHHMLGKIWILLIFDSATVYFAVITGADAGIQLGFFIILCLCFILFGNWRVSIPLSLLPMASLLLTQTMQEYFRPAVAISEQTDFIVRLCIGQTIMIIFSSIMLFARTRILSLERELRRMLRRRENLLTLLSHDIRNPLTVTIASLGLMQSERYQAQPQLQQQKLQKAMHSLSRIDMLLRNVRSLLAMQCGKVSIKKEHHAVQVLLDQLQELFDAKLRDKEQTLRIRNCHSPYAHISCDADLILLSAFGNILSNAIKFSPRGSSIELRCDCRENEACFDFIDAGVGIDPQAQNFLFSETHPTTRPGTENEPGTGFGLPLAAEVIRLHGGRIEVQSPIGTGAFPGSLFRICLPQS